MDRYGVDLVFFYLAGHGFKLFGSRRSSVSSETHIFSHSLVGSRGKIRCAINSIYSSLFWILFLSTPFQELFRSHLFYFYVVFGWYFYTYFLYRLYGWDATSVRGSHTSLFLLPIWHNLTLSYHPCRIVIFLFSPCYQQIVFNAIVP